MASDIFVCYSSEDREIVRKIVAPLEREAVVWWDRDLVLGDRYEPTIFNTIAEAPVTLVVVSQSSIASDWVVRESQEALRCGAKVIPIIIDSTPLPEHLKHLHAIDLTAGPVDETDPLLVGILRDVRLLLDQARERRVAAARQQLQRTVADVPDRPSGFFFVDRAIFRRASGAAVIAHLVSRSVIGSSRPKRIRQAFARHALEHTDRRAGDATRSFAARGVSAPVIEAASSSSSHGKRGDFYD